MPNSFLIIDDMLGIGLKSVQVVITKSTCGVADAEHQLPILSNSHICDFQPPMLFAMRVYQYAHDVDASTKELRVHLPELAGEECSLRMRLSCMDGPDLEHHSQCACGQS